MDTLFSALPIIMADASAASSAMHEVVTPLVRMLAGLASLACVFFLVTGGIGYITSRGNPEHLDHAKRVLKNALIGLVIVLSATVMTAILTHAYGDPAAGHQTALPQLQQVEPQPVSNGLVDILIKAVTGLLNNIIQSVAQPFLAALAFFTEKTELMADNSAVFNLWLAMVGIADVLFVLIVALLGFQVMSASTFGFHELDIKQLLPRFGLIFLGMNSSIFLIDGFIEVSNGLIKAVGAASSTGSVWEVLTEVVKETGGQGVAALLIMVAFLILTVILLVYYVGRLVTLYIGAVLSPLVFLSWLMPGFRDFAETAAKTYLTTIYVLFVHVVILELAAALFSGMALGSDAARPSTLMAMITGLAVIIALLKTQGVLMQFSYVSMGARNSRKLGSQFINGVSYMTGKSKAASSAVRSRRVQAPTGSHTAHNRKRVSSGSGAPTYKQPKSTRTHSSQVQQTRQSTKPKAPTGTTTPAPKTKPRVTPTEPSAPFDPTNVNKKRRSKP
jgi:hypothetical protein